MIGVVGYLGLMYTANAMDKYFPSTAFQTKPILGTGYNNETQSFVGDCVEGDIDWVGMQESSIQFDRGLSNTELSENLGFSVGGKARYGMVSGEASAKFASESSSDEYSESTIYKAIYSYKNAKLKYKGLTSVGKLAMGETGFSSQNWKTTCGHSYVDQVKLGAMIFISAKVDFATKEDKNAFSAEFKIKGPAFSVQGALEKASKRFGKSASISIRAFQLGGNVSRLSGIFNNKVDEGNNENKEVHSLLTCSMEKIDSCLKVLDMALRYATDIHDPMAFPNQIKENSNINDYSGPAHLGHVVRPWSNLGIYSMPELLEQGIEFAREQLSHHFEEQLKYKNRIFALKSAPFRLSIRQQEMVEKNYAIVMRNIEKIMKKVPSCYLHLNNCISDVANLTQEISTLSQKDFEIIPEIFSQLCDLYLVSKLSKDQNHTVSMIMEYLKEENDFSVYPDICSAAMKIIETDGVLNLSHKNIKNLRPIKMILPNLLSLDLSSNNLSDDQVFVLKNANSSIVVLNLMNNHIRNVDFLSDFYSLQHLYLSGNKINNLDALKDKTELKTLWASNNKIPMINFVVNLLNLRELLISNNGIKDISVLGNGNYPKLINLDISHNKIVDFSPLYNLENLEELNAQENPKELDLELQEKFQNPQL